MGIRTLRQTDRDPIPRFIDVCPLDFFTGRSPNRLMSGSGGGGGGGGGGEQFDCETLIERTSISSPVPEVIKKLHVADQLEVRIGRQGDADILQAVDSAGEVAGSLVPASLPRFIMCIRQGSEYVAVIQSIDGGRVRVEIRPGAH